MLQFDCICNMFYGFKTIVMQAFSFAAAKEDFHWGIVPTITFTTHRSLHAITGLQCTISSTAILGATDRNGHTSILVDAEADYNIKNNKGLSAIERAYGFLDLDRRMIADSANREMDALDMASSEALCSTAQGTQQLSNLTKASIKSTKRNWSVELNQRSRL